MELKVKPIELILLKAGNRMMVKHWVQATGVRGIPWIPHAMKVSRLAFQDNQLSSYQDITSLMNQLTFRQIEPKFFLPKLDQGYKMRLKLQCNKSKQKRGSSAQLWL